MTLEAHSTEQLEMDLENLPLDDGSAAAVRNEVRQPALQLIGAQQTGIFPAEDSNPEILLTLIKPENHENPTRLPRYEVTQQDTNGEDINRSEDNRIFFSTLKKAQEFIKEQHKLRFRGVLVITEWKKHIVVEDGEEKENKGVECGTVLERYLLN